MPELFIISDTHFGHAKTIEFANRPFDNVEEMNESIIELWNYTVGKRDTVIHLGDWGINTKSYDIAGRLKGYKRLILGNHDRCDWSRLNKYFNSVHGSLRKYEFLMTHQPVFRDYSERWEYNIHGHIHDKDKQPKDWRYYNANVDVLNYYGPISFDEIREEMKRRRIDSLFYNMTI